MYSPYLNKGGTIKITDAMSGEIEVIPESGVAEFA